ncbi:MAG: hypothetical protein AVDCRST_MAG89-4993 [uncultured Gemmatimonadetes bacterium]|uniref:Uncharacterized protein n=1 Tax=uncultured Gemmatimonadota bacterium TaxID=203437 RepID=A0A6J4N3Z1_9BACT|nr:MAG: hypothetical protein AVDCRST_MAG89-4993 [uncultured Gemmatimonadota bacterium]
MMRHAECVADPSVAAIDGAGAGRAWPLRRDDRCAAAGEVNVQVKPRAGRDSGPSRGFPLSQRRVHPLMDRRGFPPSIRLHPLTSRFPAACRTCGETLNPGV